MATFVLVHGSWHDGTLWADVADRLTERGHEVHSPTIAGHGPGASRAVTHDDCVASITQYLDEHSLGDFVLVGHSFGGSVIARVAERLPDRVRRLVFLNAFVPVNGTSVLDNTPPAYQELFPQLAAQTTDDTVMLPFEVWREAFIGDADLARAEETYRLLTPEPLGPTVEKLDLTKFYSLTHIPRSYVLCGEDAALPPGDPDHGYLANARRLGVFRLVTLDGSHEVMFTNPALLATKLELAGRD
ncbi:alpha/beta fold hydrolase [Amycolatopsis rhabdoformis]|uniref:Alpha/beta fold hydrolase n=1 Tax=Amycolatopsis rhabdoformis TaxID=1448059 RepID=A0ABZ1IDJ5_9PSEU|nr:alpha/beta fold hydrolase [Amycolatopsis rhabdoformis]WSE32534.1 alpha/beta fold hydrolase [Amycolatopsis rhabdoformis]